MSMVIRLVIGWFDADQAVANRYRMPVPTRPLTPDDVHRLQARCDAVFGPRLRLAPFLADGLISLSTGALNDEMYRIACVAHDGFGMSAVDVHHQAAYPWEDACVDSILDDAQRIGGTHAVREITAMADAMRRIREELQASGAAGAPG
jgi:hypothetical protein